MAKYLKDIKIYQVLIFVMTFLYLENFNKLN